MDKNLASGQNLDSRYAQNEPSPTQPVVYTSPQSFGEKLKENWMLIVFLPVILVFAFFLNYFNILPLSAKLPQVFGFLPHQASSQTFGTSVQPTQVASAPSAKPYVCPVEKKLCKDADSVAVPKTIPPFSGLGYDNLASGSAVLAITSGKYNSGVSVDTNGIKTTVLTILDDIKNVEVDYQFKGKAYTPAGAGRGKVKSGDVIGWISDQKLEKGLLLKPYYLIVSVQDLKSKEFIKLNTAELLKSTP